MHLLGPTRGIVTWFLLSGLVRAIDLDVSDERMWRNLPFSPMLQNPHETDILAPSQNRSKMPQVHRPML